MVTNSVRSKSKNYFSWFVVVTLMALFFVGGLIFGRQQEVKIQKQLQGQVSGVGQVPDYLKKNADFSLLWDAWSTVKDNYVNPNIPDTQLLYGAIAGVVASLEDPHSIFLTPDVNQEFLQELSGSFFGIGAEIAIKNNQLQVVAPLPDTPAQKSGLRSGDYILKIDGADTAKMTVNEAVSKIRGARGTKVTLTVFRPDTQETLELSIVRDEIKVESVSFEMLPDNVGLIKLRYFNQDTGDQFKAVVDQVVKKNPSSLILDMRNNPGGFLDVAIEIASQFVEDGIVVSEKFRDGTTNAHQATGQAKLKDFKLVVLINEGSASASEIVAGALKDHGLAKLVGKKSYGKGSVQTLFDLKDGSSIKLTIAKWLTPNGNTIDGVGITPDVEVDLTDKDFNDNKDPQLDKAVEILKSELK